jgi:hypothetical protein
MDMDSSSNELVPVTVYFPHGNVLLSCFDYGKYWYNEDSEQLLRDNM